MLGLCLSCVFSHLYLLLQPTLRSPFISLLTTTNSPPLHVLISWEYGTFHAGTLLASSLAPGSLSSPHSYPLHIDPSLAPFAGRSTYPGPRGSLWGTVWWFRCTLWVWRRWCRNWQFVCCICLYHYTLNFYSHIEIVEIRVTFWDRSVRGKWIGWPYTSWSSTHYMMSYIFKHLLCGVT